MPYGTCQEATHYLGRPENCVFFMKNAGGIHLILCYPYDCLSAYHSCSLSLAIYIYTNISGSGERLRSGIRSFQLLELSGLSSALVAQNCSKSPRARPEPLRIVQNGRSELFEEPLRVAQSAPRAAQSCSGSPRARPELLRAAQNRLERAQSRSEPF